MFGADLVEFCDVWGDLVELCDVWGNLVELCDVCCRFGGILCCVEQIWWNCVMCG